MSQFTVVGKAIGNPQIKTTESGKKLANIKIQETRSLKNSNDSDVDVYSITCWNQTAEDVEKNLIEGTFVSVFGKMRTTEYEKDGEIRYYPEFVADRVNILI